MRPEIPLEILGLLGPLMAWVEGSQPDGLPINWINEVPESDTDILLTTNPDELAASFQERSWLLHQLPNYSLDNIEDVIAFARRDNASRPSGSRWKTTRAKVAPPSRYDLFRVFEKLAERYLTWNGGEVCIRAGRMVEIHELGLRVPLSFLIRHVHARAVAAGEKTLGEVVNLPESISLLPSNAHGMRGVIRRGLSETHLHMNSIHAAETAWADHLLKPQRHKPKRFDHLEWRLLHLGKAASQTLALATILCRTKKEPKLGQVLSVLDAFDELYFKGERFFHDPTTAEFRIAFNELADENLIIAELIEVDNWRGGSWLKGRPLGSVPNTGALNNLGLLHWIPSWGSVYRTLGRTKAETYGLLRHAVDRERCLSSLHLAAHLELVRARFLARRKNGLSAGTEESRDLQQSDIPYGNVAARFLHRSYFRYLVCQTHYWQLAVQQGRTTGLRRFKNFFESNQRRLIEPTDRQAANSVVRRAMEWRGLRALEGRVSPPDSSGSDFLPWLHAYAANAQGNRIEKMGLVVHFIKNSEKLRRPQTEGFYRARFAALRSEYRRQAFLLFRILERPSLVTPFVVGIDAANLELATPPEVFAPVFRFLREKPIALGEPDTISLDARLCGGPIRELVGKRRLGMTYHVGEDFRHLLSGLRAIDEVVEFLAPSPGDRLGHCIALGIDPTVWLKQVGYQALIPKQEWLDTLVWLYHFLGPGEFRLGRLGIEATIVRLGRELYPFPSGDSSVQKKGKRNPSLDPPVVTPFSLWDVWRLRQLDPEFLDLDEPDDPIKFRPKLGCDSATWRWNRISKQILETTKNKIGKNPPVALLTRYWYNEKSKQEGEKLELVDMEEKAELWVEVCQMAQSEMQKKIAQHQLAVEVNPSSNRVIGPMGQYSEHHIFNLTLDERNTWKRRLRVTVNTDNPGTANTSLAHEYYLLGESLMSRGIPEAEVVKWLEWLREVGEQGSFVRPLPKADDPRMKRIFEGLKLYPQPLRELHDPDACLSELWRRWPGFPEEEMLRVDSSGEVWIYTRDGRQLKGQIFQ